MQEQKYSRRKFFGYLVGGLGTAIFGATVIVPRTKLLGKYLEETIFDGYIDRQRVKYYECNFSSSYMKIYSADGKLQKTIFDASLGNNDVIGDNFFDKYVVFTPEGTTLYTNHSLSKYEKITWGKTAEAIQKLAEATQIFNDKKEKIRKTLEMRL